MTTSSIATAWFIGDMVKITTDMWLKGWDERNGGNISFRLLAEDVEPYQGQWCSDRVVPLEERLPGLAGQFFLVTGSGKYFRNVQLDPEHNLGLIRVTASGDAVEILWGYSGGGVPTSELSAHLNSHQARQKSKGSDTRGAIVHCHATNLIALSYVLQFDTPNVTRALWEGSTECLVVFPEGVGTVPWMVPGTTGIGDATAREMAEHPIVLWQYHGVFGTGRTLDEAFGLIDTAEKSALILVRLISMGGPRQTITTANLAALAQRFGVKPQAAAMALNGWRLAPV